MARKKKKPITKILFISAVIFAISTMILGLLAIFNQTKTLILLAGVSGLLFVLIGMAFFITIAIMFEK